MEQLQEKESENGTDFTCEICIEPNSLTNKFRNANRCSHPFCTDCVITYICSKLENNNTGKIKCPATHCINMLDPLDCASLIGSPMFLRWSDMLCEAAVIGQDKCYCPRINCNELILNECGGKQGKTKCPKCKSWFCFQCKIDWHSGFRCDESLQLRDDNDVAFGRLAESNKWRRCPQCSYYCEKVDGCDFVKCRCGTGFCYNCGRLMDVTFGHICGGCHPQATRPAATRPAATCCNVCLNILCSIFLLAFFAGLFGLIWWWSTLA